MGEMRPETEKLKRKSVVRPLTSADKEKLGCIIVRSKA